jgi:flagellar biosynthesis protein FlhB
MIATKILNEKNELSGVENEELKIKKLKERFRNISSKSLNLFFSIVVFCYILAFFYDVYALIINSILLFIIILDTVYVMVKRRGREWKWFSISVFSFSLLLICFIWTIYFFKIQTEYVLHHISVPVSKPSYQS